MNKKIYKLYLLFGLLFTVKNWFEYLINNFYLKKNTIVTLRNNLRFIVRFNSGDMVAIIEDYFTNQYFPYIERDFIKDWVIVDVGSHIGTFSIQAAFECEITRIIALEPDRENFNQLKKNVKLNLLTDKIDVYNMAMWESSGTIKIYYEPRLTLGSSIVTAPSESSQQVMSITIHDLLDKYIKDECDLMKIDIEGAEYEVILNSDLKDLKRIRRVFVEYHKRPDEKFKAKNLVKKLIKSEFIVFKRINSPILYAFRKNLIDIKYIDKKKLKRVI